MLMSGTKNIYNNVNYVLALFFNTLFVENVVLKSKDDNVCMTDQLQL